MYKSDGPLLHFLIMPFLSYFNSPSTFFLWKTNIDGAFVFMEEINLALEWHDVNKKMFYVYVSIILFSTSL